MKTMLRRTTGACMLAAGLLACEGALSTAQACPSCRAANATDSRLPMAYQASILFMLGVPAMLVSGLTFGLYKLNKSQEEALAAFESGDVWQGDPGDDHADEAD